MLRTEIAQKIKQIRKQKKLSQRYLADILGCNNGFICQVEKGKSFYNLDHIEKICAALNYPVARLFGDDTYPQDEIPPGQIAQNQADPIEWALVEVYRGLSSDHKGKLLGAAEDLRLAEAPPPRISKKGGAAA